MQIGRDHLATPAAAAATAFSVVAGLLADVRAAVADLCLRLQDLDAVLASQSGNARLLDTVETAALTVSRVVGEAASRAAPERVDSAVSLALSCLEEIGSCTREIEAVATLTSVTSRSLSLNTFDDYVVSLRRMITTMRGDAVQLSATVTALQSRRINAVELFGRANADLVEVTAMLQAVTDERAATEALLLQSLEEVAALAHRLPADTASEIEVLMRAIQFADALAQRLDHIGMVLAFDRHLDEGATSDTGPLARAQIEALVNETRETADAALRSLARIGERAGGVGQIMGSENESPARQALQLGQEILSRISARTQSVLAAIEGAEGESNALCASAAEAAERFVSVTAATDEMHIHAINAALLARRGAAQQGAMNVLSVEVQRKAAQCARAATACHGAITQLSLAEDLAAFGAVAPGATAFRRAIKQTAAAVDAAGLAGADLHRTRMATSAALDRLAAATEMARTAIRAIYASTDDLTALAQSLPGKLQPGADPLLPLMEIYSMEAERLVHRRLFGLPDNVLPALASDASLAETEEDLLASIMF